jgi:pullulanase
MKKITTLFLLALSLLWIGLTSLAVDLPSKLVVHYFRYDDIYTDFNMWVWESMPSALGGIQHNFNPAMKDEHGVYFEINLTTSYPTATTLGIIIKKGGWDGYREVGGDRFINLETVEVIDGTAHAYFVEQDLRIGTSQDNLENNIPDYRAKVLSALFDTQKRISAKLSHIPELGYEVYENDILVLSGTSTSKTLLLTVPNVNISKSYVLKVLFSAELSVEISVSLQNLYDTADFEQMYSYDGTLGVSFEEEFTIFRLWAPLSQSVSLNLYNQGHPNYNDQGIANNELLPYQVEPLSKIENGAWEVRLTGDYDFDYYTFTVTNNGQSNEVVDPYAYSTGANGLRGMIVNFGELNPTGWEYGARPDTIEKMTDYIIYELHVRDLTTHSSWNGTESYRGTFMGFTEKGTTYSNDETTVTTGLDHLVELGVNAVQLLPIFDFGYVDEVQVANNPNYSNSFNWGYMPYNFNTLEGSYSTNPFDGKTRINEFKQLVMALHQEDIRVIMDVVYNHTGESSTSNFHKIVPGYYHRLNESGGFENGSGTGNETASERSMMQKFMLDSVEFWATEYNLSGFRFDLMALHDVDTMNEIQAMLEDIDPSLIIYGEPWTGGTSPLSEDIRADKENLSDMNLVGAFNDYTRDAVKGSVFTASEKGWVQGNATVGNIQGIKYGIVGGIEYPGLTAMAAWHLNPNQTINYVTAHDNNTLYDKIRLTGITNVNAKAMVIQSNAIILTSQGISFLHAGVDFMRSKPLLPSGYDHNSYESPDSVNQLRWDRKANYEDVFLYYKALIQIRKTYTHFSIGDADQIRQRLAFLTTDQATKSISFQIDGLEGEPDIIVLHSGAIGAGLTKLTLPAGKTYRILTNFETADPDGIEIVSGTVYAPANTSMIMVEETAESISIKNPFVTIDKDDAFNPASNVDVLNTNATIYYSSYHNVNVPGRYTITVAVVESYGVVKHFYYTLYVRGYGYDITLEIPETGD